MKTATALLSILCLILLSFIGVLIYIVNSPAEKTESYSLHCFECEPPWKGSPQKFVFRINKQTGETAFLVRHNYNDTYFDEVDREKHKNDPQKSALWWCKISGESNFTWNVDLFEK